MYTEEDLASAVRDGALSTGAADALRAHVASQRRGHAIDEEQFRLITGFNDVFVVIACLLLLGSLWSVGRVVAPVVGPVLGAVAAWGLAEFFTRKRRMALPSIVLTIAVAGGVFAATTKLVHGGPGIALGALLAGGAMVLHWFRFKVPISVAVATASVVGLVVATLTGFWPDVRSWILVLCFASGIAVFAFALRWDMSDPTRETRRADVAFWLHLLAAPLIVHPVFMSLGVFDGQTGTATLLAVLVLYVTLGVVSLAIDRRALMVSALGYVLYAFSALMTEQGFVTVGFAITGLTIGSALLMLSAFWHVTRRTVLRALPRTMRMQLAVDRP